MVVMVFTRTYVLIAYVGRLHHHDAPVLAAAVTLKEKSTREEKEKSQHENVPRAAFYHRYSFEPRCSLDFSDFADIIDDEQFQYMASQLTSRCVEMNLSKLKLIRAVSSCSIFFARIPKLRSLILQRVSGFTPGMWKVIAMEAPMIEVLDIQQSDAISDKIIKIIATYYRNLRSINIAHCTKMTDAGLMLLSQKISSIEHLDVSFCMHLTDRSLRLVMTQHGETLQSIKYSGCPNVRSFLCIECKIGYNHSYMIPC